MTTDIEVLRALGDAGGTDAVRPATAADAVVGVSPSFVVAPSDTETLAALMKTAADHDLVVVPRGEGTKLHWGSPPIRVDVIVDMVRLTGIHQHYADDLVATIGAGTQVRTVQALLASTGQRLAIDPGSVDATIGGLLASGEAGPLRMRHGTPRDQLLGMEFVSADGTIAHSGGRVVKNVAGYDLGKLICGSFGTLALITSATMRLHPLPAARAWVIRPVYTPLEVNDLVDDLLASRLEPTAIEVDLPGSGPGELAVLLEGSTAGVRTRSRDTIRLLGGQDVTVSPEAPRWWGTYPFGPDDVAIKLAAPVADLHAAIYALRDAIGSPVPVRGSAGVGVCFAALPVDSAILAIDAARTTLMARGGTCVVVTAPAEIREKVDIWGPVGGLELMRSVKNRFDPAGRLAPGRFVGGI